ncbi:MAG: adenylate kinase [Ruminococcaceae bacterium]|nr:adenylate kinase [Oscillospiraceae bacterium]
MNKVIVIGCPGSGKSTFSRALHTLTSLPLYHLDLLKWNSDKTTVSKEVFLERLQNVLMPDKWSIDGNYGSTIELRLKECDTVFFLDYPMEVCIDGIRQRQGKPRSDMPWIETEDDAEFLEFIRNYNAQSRPKVLELLNNYPQKDVIIFKNREEADEYLNKII